MSFCLDFLRNWHLYGTLIWESMSSGRYKKLMKLAGFKVSTWSQKIGKKLRKFENFQKCLEMIGEYFRRNSRMILCILEVFWK